MPGPETSESRFARDQRNAKLVALRRDLNAMDELHANMPMEERKAAALTLSSALRMLTYVEELYTAQDARLAELDLRLEQLEAHPLTIEPPGYKPLDFLPTNVPYERPAAQPISLLEMALSRWSQTARDEANFGPVPLLHITQVLNLVATALRHLSERLMLVELHCQQPTKQQPADDCSRPHDLHVTDSDRAALREMLDGLSKMLPRLHAALDAHHKPAKVE